MCVTWSLHLWLYRHQFVSWVPLAPLYFATAPFCSIRAPQAPLPEPMLYLNGDSQGVINNMCFPTTVSTSYAPQNEALVSVSTMGTLPELDDAQLEAAVRAELRAWWGEEAAGWQHLKTYRIPFAQPNQEPPTDLQRPVSLGGGVYVCGDHREAATLDGVCVCVCVCARVRARGWAAIWWST